MEEHKPQTFEDACAPAGTRRKRGRRPIPDDLPRVEVVHDLPESEQTCPCGTVLVRIGEEVSEKLDIVPAKIQVIRHIRPKYACRICEGVEDDGPIIYVGRPGRNAGKTGRALSLSPDSGPAVWPQIFLGDYQCYLQTDGYSGYEALDKREGIRHFGCMAHVRRKFVEVEKTAGKKAKGGTAPGRIGPDRQALRCGAPSRKAKARLQTK